MKTLKIKGKFFDKNGRFIATNRQYRALSVELRKLLDKHLQRINRNVTLIEMRMLREVVVSDVQLHLMMAYLKKECGNNPGKPFPTRDHGVRKEKS